MGIAPHVPPADARPGDAAAAARGGTAILVLQSLGRVFALLFVVAATRTLSPEELSRYSLAAAVTLLATIVSDLGVTPVLTAAVSRQPRHSERLLSATLLTSAGLGLVGYLAAIGFAVVAYPPQAVGDVALAGLGIPASAMASSVFAALDGHRLLARRSGITLAQTTVTALGGLALVQAGAGTRGALGALAMAPWVALALGAASARRHAIWSGRLRFDAAASWELLRRALPFAVGGGIGAVILRLDVVLLSLLASPTDVVTYDVAQRLVESLGYLTSAVCIPALVMISARLGTGRRSAAGQVYREAVRIAYLLGLPASMVVALGAEDIVGLVFGPSYRQAAAPLAVLGAGLWVLFVTQVQVVVITAGLRVALGLGLAVVHLAVVVALDLALIPHFGPGGAAGAMVASWVLMAFAYDRLHRRTLGARTPLPPARVVAACAPLGAWLVLAGPRMGLAAVAVGLVVYVASVVLTRAVGTADLERVRLLWSSSRPTPTVDASADDDRPTPAARHQLVDASGERFS
ncbi:MAG: oligosaccharide flippase family protein [Actinobacteria bacterium]|nr:oligosaccharide flippase family protein [Actinomycetota bacterium]